MLRRMLILVLVPFILVRFSSAQETEAQQQLVEVLSRVGIIQGTIQDVESGEPLVGATVTLKNTNLGAITDISGNFKINNVPAGEHMLEVISIGYAQYISTSVTVQAGQINQVNLTLKSEPIEFKEIEVQAKAFENTDGSVLKQRQKTLAITDAISAETFAKTGAGNAADAMRYGMGASVVDGKFVYIRGMGERYVTAQLNGSSLPSPDPDKKAFQLDLFPTNLLDNMTTVKSFTPDKPGDFSGGSINLKTKSFPEKLNMSFTGTSGYNSRVNFKDNFLTYPGGNRDWLGYDDGTRSLPDPLSDPNVKIPYIGESYTNKEKAYLLDFYSKSFNSTMSPTRRTTPLNQSYSFALGNQTNLFGKPFGFVGNLTYSRKFSYYDQGTTGQYHLTGNVNTVDQLDQDMLLTDAKGTDEVLWGGLVNFTYNLTPQHQLQTNYIYNRSGESMARFQSGHIYNLPPENVYETRVLKYTERALNSLQLSGKHNLKKSKNWELQWSSSLTNSSQDEPDLRFFSNDYVIITATDTQYTNQSNVYLRPALPWKCKWGIAG